MGLLVLACLLAFAAAVLIFIKLPENLYQFKMIGIAVLALASLGTFGKGGMSYNNAGYCTHISTIFGTEDSTCNLGWYFSGWGKSTPWPQQITITHTKDPEDKGSSVNNVYPIRMADNWSGDVTQTSRFSIPRDPELFLKMHSAFRSPQRLITSTLKPAVEASLDSVANLYTMEEYYAGGKRDNFKTDFNNTLIRGRAVMDRVEVEQSNLKLNSGASPNSDELAQDTAIVGSQRAPIYVSKIRLDNKGQEIRIPHEYTSYGIGVTSAILRNLDPIDVFEKQIQKRKDAAARRVIAKEQRSEEEELRLLTIAKGEKNIAERQAEARTNQIQETTEAETTKKLALIRADQLRSEARISKETAEIILEKEKIDAEAKRVKADATAYEKQAILAADGALALKGQWYVETQKVWADAYAKRKVPTTIFGGSNGTSSSYGDNGVKTFMDIMTMKASNDLNLNMKLPKQK